MLCQFPKCREYACLKILHLKSWFYLGLSTNCKNMQRSLSWGRFFSLKLSLVWHIMKVVRACCFKNQHSKYFNFVFLFNKACLRLQEMCNTLYYHSRARINFEKWHIKNYFPSLYSGDNFLSVFAKPSRIGYKTK